MCLRSPNRREWCRLFSNQGFHQTVRFCTEQLILFSVQGRQGDNRLPRHSNESSKQRPIVVFSRKYHKYASILLFRSKSVRIFTLEYFFSSFSYSWVWIPPSLLMWPLPTRLNWWILDYHKVVHQRSQMVMKRFIHRHRREARLLSNTHIRKSPNRIMLF